MIIRAGQWSRCADDVVVGVPFLESLSAANKQVSLELAAREGSRRIEAV
jgi:hypothetical protein